MVNVYLYYLIYYFGNVVMFINKFILNKSNICCYVREEMYKSSFSNSTTYIFFKSSVIRNAHVVYQYFLFSNYM